MDVKVLSPKCRDHVSHIKTGIVTITFRVAEQARSKSPSRFRPMLTAIIGWRSEKPHRTLYSLLIGVAVNPRRPEKCSSGRPERLREAGAKSRTLFYRGKNRGLSRCFPQK